MWATPGESECRSSNADTKSHASPDQSLQDIPHPDRDRALAEHITHVHRYKSVHALACSFLSPLANAEYNALLDGAGVRSTHPDLDFEPLKAEFIRAYVAQARRVDPFIPKQLSTYIVEVFDCTEACAASTTMTTRAMLCRSTCPCGSRTVRTRRPKANCQ